jgi:glycosyltransferase involved in cell wall biosynthesis
LQIFHVADISIEPSGGVARAIQNVCLAVASNGDPDVESAVVTFDLDSSHTSPQQSQQHGIDIVHFPNVGARGFRLPPTFESWLRQLTPASILHLHGTFSPRTFAVARACLRAGVPYVFTPHDTYVPISIRQRRLAKFLYLRFFDRWVLNHAQGIQALSEIGKADLDRITPNQFIGVVPDIVEPLNATPTPPHERSGLITVGRLDIFQKGLDRLLHTIATLHENNGAVQLTVVGEGSTNEQKTLETLAARLGLQDGRDVCFTGRVSDERKACLVSQSKFFVQLSRFEGFGLAAVEALSLGIPTVISKEFPISELIESHGAGYRVEDTEQAATILWQTLELSPDEYDEMSRRARQLFESEFHSDSALQQLLRFYRNAFERRDRLSDLQTGLVARSELPANPSSGNNG